MIDEKTRRRAEYESGIEVLLSDGQSWTLPIPNRSPREPDLTALLEAMMTAEDRADRLRLELALTIWLLNKNYLFSPNEIETLLNFPQGDPGLKRLQEDVHGLSTRILIGLDPAKSPSSAVPPAGPRGR